jgi:hypothetical protein
MRVALLIAFVALLIGCESRPAFQVPRGPAVPIALDVSFARYTEGRWALDEFEGELTLQLAKYNFQVVDRKTKPDLVARVDLGLLGYRQAVDVYLVQAGTREYAGRVRVPDLSMPTLDAATPLVAEVVARAYYKPSDASPEAR